MIRKLKVFLQRYLIVLSGTFFLIFIILATSIRFESFYFINSKSVVSNPYSTYVNKGDEPGVHKFKGIINKHFFSRKWINLNVDDCIADVKINGVVVNVLQHYSGKLCKTERGIDFYIDPYLHAGKNEIEITIRDDGGYYGIYVRDSLKDIPYIIYSCCLWVNICCLIALLWLKLNLNKRIFSVFFGGLFLRLWYLTYTDFSVRSYDVEGHIDHILFISRYHILPALKTCWECHQKPLYYIFAAKLLSIFHLIHTSDIFIVLQLASLCMFMIMLAIGWVIINKLIKVTQIKYILFSLLVFWPSGIIHSVRIGNDVMTYMGMMIFLYFLIKWFEKKSQLYTLLCVLSAFFVYFTKSTGLILFVILVIVWLYQKGFPFKNKNKFWLILFFGFSLLLFLSVNLENYRHMAIFEELDKITKAQDLNRGLIVQNGFKNFFYFDWHAYVDNQFISAWSDETGRQYFINYLLKSSLFGEFNFNTLIHQYIAIVMNFLLLGMVSNVFLGYLYIKSKIVKFNFPIVIFGIMNCMLLVLYRKVYPYACNNDFRFIFPVVICFVYCYGIVLVFLKKQNKLYYYFNFALIYLFIGYSILFYLLFPFFTT